MSPHSATDISTYAQKRMLLAVLLPASFMAQADATIGHAATPSIHRDRGASAAELELVVGGYNVAFSVLLITGARLEEMHGYRRIFLVRIAAFGTDRPSGPASGNVLFASLATCRSGGVHETSTAPNANDSVVALSLSLCGFLLRYPTSIWRPRGRLARVGVQERRGVLAAIAGEVSVVLFDYCHAGAMKRDGSKIETPARSANVA
jgi:MFS family permease